MIVTCNLLLPSLFLIVTPCSFIPEREETLTIKLYELYRMRMI